MGLVDKIRGARGSACVGMELSTNAVKIALLNRKGERTILQGGLVSPIPKVSINMSLEKREDLGKQITAIWRSAGIKVNKVRLSIPGKLTFTGRINLSPEEEGDIEERVLSILSAKIPISSPEELSMGYFVYSRSKGMLDILYVAVKKSVVDFYQEIFAHSELELNALYSTPLALANVVNANYPNDMVDLLFMVVDVGAYESNVVAMKENRLVASISLDTGGILVTHNLATHLGFPLKDAEKMKLMGKGNEAVLREGAYQIATQLREGIERCLEEASAFLGSSERLEAILLTGGGSLTPFLLAELFSLLGTRVEHLLPIRKIELHPDLNPTQTYEISPQLSVAIGTALSGIR